MHSVKEGCETELLPRAALRFCKVRRSTHLLRVRHGGPLWCLPESPVAAHPSIKPQCLPVWLPARPPATPQGVAFVTQRKAGLVAGVNWGSGFAIQRQPDGSWSAPCFLSMRYGSLGLTLGMQTIQSCHLLQVCGLRGAGGTRRRGGAHPAGQPANEPAGQPVGRPC